MFRPDLPTTLLSYALCNVMAMLLVFTLWRQSRQQHAGTGHWLACFALQGLGTLLVLARGRLPDFVTMVLANAMIIGGLLLLQVGLARFLEYRHRVWPGRLLFVAFLLLQGYFSLVDVDAHARNLLISAVMSLYMGETAVLLLARLPPARRPVAALTAWIFVALTLVSLVRMVLELVWPAQPANAMSSPQTAYIALVYQMFALLLSFSLSLMVNRKLVVRMQLQLQELATARSDAEEASRSKSAFLANMSHEIRTPLNAVLGMSHLALQADPSPRQRELLQKIQRSGQHLLAVISDILDFSKIEADKLVLEEAPLDLPTLVNHVAELLDGTARDKGLHLSVQVEPVPYRLLGDATRLEQALLNLAGNAVKFTPAGSVTLRAEVEEASAQAVLLRLEVHDTGVGIASHILPRLFNPFVQVDNSTTRQFGGTGLGLSITRRLAQAMDGDVGVDSVEGAGSSFWFTARLRIQEGASVDPPIAVPDSAAPMKDLTGRSVLLVEDDEFSRELGQLMLQDWGVEVALAENGQQAVEMAAGGAYDLILMDMQMPVLDGLQATRRIRGTGASMPIIALTANAFSDDQQRCLEAGMDDYLTKPIDANILREVLSRHL